MTHHFTHTDGDPEHVQQRKQFKAARAALLDDGTDLDPDGIDVITEACEPDSLPMELLTIPPCVSRLDAETARGRRPMLLRSLSELGECYAREALDAVPPPEESMPPSSLAPTHAMASDTAPPADEAHRDDTTGDDLPDLAALHAELDAAAAALDAVAYAEEQARDRAMADLATYDAAVAKQRDAQGALAHARHVRERADAVVAGAFDNASRTAAQRVLDAVTRAEATAICLCDDASAAVSCLQSSFDLERLLEERQRREAAETERAAEAERARRLADLLARANEALAAGNFEDARALVGSLAKDIPNSPDVSSLMASIGQREAAVKAAEAEQALWTVRRQLRRKPAEAIARLQSLDVDHLPVNLSRQVFGAWSDAAARLCKERGITAPLRYAPDPGRGVVLAREASGHYTVVASLGVPTLPAGSSADALLIRLARPLR